MSSISIDKSVAMGLKDLLGYLLDSDKVDSVLTMRRIPETGAWDLALITDSGNLGEAEPLAPVMTVNAGKELSSLSLSGKRIAAVLKPCELRALIERVKREQGSLQNLLTISHTCSGVFPLEQAADGSMNELLPKYEKVASMGEVPSSVRDTCKACQHFIPVHPDIMLASAGAQRPGEGCVLYLEGGKAEEALREFRGVRDDRVFDPSSLDRTAAARKKERDRLFARVENDCSGLDGLLNVFGKCVGCHGCSRVCPICYCALCDFESMNFDYNLPYFEEHLSRRGALRLPPDTVMFHLGRLTHMSFSCVGCGMCSDVCPVGIPVAAVFSRTGERTASLFDYVPGRSLTEEIPVMVFKEEEFSELG
ncbi:MAG: 4Fe-4S binding protein [Candidatus Fermentibacteraceae bacterium]|nr:4Fe-4S binding protein [Candidatus Fermentibacteraceae bacterium]MBN2608539.1 4Fe-4S binding protein [Candidatus Fermentibacteraceae bacterium]